MKNQFLIAAGLAVAATGIAAAPAHAGPCRIRIPPRRYYALTHRG